MGPVVVSDAIAAARVFILRKGEYYAPVLYELTFCPVKDLGTMATTKDNVVCFDPKWVGTIPTEEVAGTIVHEMHHVIRHHLPRMEAFRDIDNDTLNIAADLTINPQITTEGWVLPFKVMPADYGLKDGLTFEEYVHLLRTSPPPKGSGGGGGPGHGKCGGVAGNPHSKEDGVKPPSGKDPQSMADAVQECIRSAAKGVGAHRNWWRKLEASLDMPVKVPWRTVYRGIMAEMTGGITLGCSDYTYSRRSRRQLLAQSQLPKSVEHTPEVCVILDTSGSMGSLMGVAVSETRSLLRGLGIERVWLLQADTHVRSEERASVHSLRNVELRGGGGTSFDHALQVSARLRPRPDFVVYLTDGYGTIGALPPIPTIFCILHGGNEETLRRFGKVVVVTGN